MKAPFTLANLESTREHPGVTMMSIVDGIYGVLPDGPQPITTETIITPEARPTTSLDAYMRSFKIPYFERRWGEFTSDEVSLHPSPCRPPLPVQPTARAQSEDPPAALPEGDHDLDVEATPKTPPSVALTTFSELSSMLYSPSSRSSYGQQGNKVHVNPFVDIWDIEIWGVRMHNSARDTRGYVLLMGFPEFACGEAKTTWREIHTFIYLLSSKNTRRLDWYLIDQDGIRINWSDLSPATPGQYLLVGETGEHTFEPSPFPALTVDDAERAGFGKTKKTTKERFRDATPSEASSLPQSRSSAIRDPDGPPEHPDNTRDACPRALIHDRDRVCYFCARPADATYDCKVAHIISNSFASELHSKYRCAFDPDAYFPAYPFPDKKRPLAPQTFKYGVNNAYIGWRLPAHPSNLMLCCASCEKAFDFLYHGINVFCEEPSRVRITSAPNWRADTAIELSERHNNPRRRDPIPFAHLYPYSDDPILELHRSALPSPLLLTIQFVGFLHSCFLCQVERPDFNGSISAKLAAALEAHRKETGTKERISRSLQTRTFAQNRHQSGDGRPNDSKQPADAPSRSTASPSDIAVSKRSVHTPVQPSCDTTPALESDDGVDDGQTNLVADRNSIKVVRSGSIPPPVDAYASGPGPAAKSDAERAPDVGAVAPSSRRALGVRELSEGPPARSIPGPLFPASRPLLHPSQAADDAAYGDGSARTASASSLVKEVKTWGKHAFQFKRTKSPQP